MALRFLEAGNILKVVFPQYSIEEHGGKHSVYIKGGILESCSILRPCKGDTRTCGTRCNKTKCFEREKKDKTGCAAFAVVM